MSTPSNPIARPAMPLPVLEAAVHTALKAKATREDYEGLLAEQRHQYFDLDPDSVCCLPGFTCVNCPPGGTS